MYSRIINNINSEMKESTEPFLAEIQKYRKLVNAIPADPALKNQINALEARITPDPTALIELLPEMMKIGSPLILKANASQPEVMREGEQAIKNLQIILDRNKAKLAEFKKESKEKKSDDRPVVKDDPTPLPVKEASKYKQHLSAEDQKEIDEQMKLYSNAKNLNEYRRAVTGYQQRISDLKESTSILAHFLPEDKLLGLMSRKDEVGKKAKLIKENFVAPLELKLGGKQIDGKLNNALIRFADAEAAVKKMEEKDPMRPILEGRITRAKETLGKMENNVKQKLLKYSSLENGPNTKTEAEGLIETIKTETRTQVNGFLEQLADIERHLPVLAAATRPTSASVATPATTTSSEFKKIATVSSFFSRRKAAATSSEHDISSTSEVKLSADHIPVKKTPKSPEEAKQQVEKIAEIQKARYQLHLANQIKAASAAPSGWEKKIVQLENEIKALCKHKLISIDYTKEMKDLPLPVNIAEEINQAVQVYADKQVLAKLAFDFTLLMQDAIILDNNKKVLSEQQGNLRLAYNAIFTDINQIISAKKADMSLDTIISLEEQLIDKIQIYQKVANEIAVKSIDHLMKWQLAQATMYTRTAALAEVSLTEEAKKAMKVEYAKDARAILLTMARQLVSTSNTLTADKKLMYILSQLKNFDPNVIRDKLAKASEKYTIFEEKSQPDFVEQPFRYLDKMMAELDNKMREIATLQNEVKAEAATSSTLPAKLKNAEAERDRLIEDINLIQYKAITSMIAMLEPNCKSGEPCPLGYSEGYLESIVRNRRTFPERELAPRPAPAKVAEKKFVEMTSARNLSLRVEIKHPPATAAAPAEPAASPKPAPRTDASDGITRTSPSPHPKR